MKRIGMLAAVVGCIVSLAVGAAAQTITVKVGIGHPPGQSFVVATEKFKEMVDKRSNGRLKVDIFHSSQLGGGARDAGDGRARHAGDERERYHGGL